MTKSGYTVSLAPRPTTTSTYTLTPIVRTIVSLTLIPQETVTLACNPTLQPHPPAIKKRIVYPTLFAVPYCSAPVITTITGRTIQVYYTSSTFTTTKVSTTRSTFTEVASSPTVFVSPSSTQTLTPRLATVRVATIIARPTIYRSSTVLYTSTKYVRGGKTKVCTQSTVSIDFAATGRISNTDTAPAASAT